jgi:hypothetical protein
MEMGNQEWNSGITKEMGNAEAFGRSLNVFNPKVLPTNEREGLFYRPIQETKRT